MMKAISILSIGALAAIIAGCLNTEHSASATGERYPWKKNIVTTVFWIGERPRAPPLELRQNTAEGETLSATSQVSPDASAAA
jgi:ABC-type glycerol-3-phosphate transport system substrate-binding protein